MGCITAEDLAGYRERRYGEYPADWIRPGATLRIQSLTERERSAIERKMIAEREKKDGPSYLSLLIQQALVDENGHRIYSDESLEFLESLDAMVTSRILAAIDEHCKMTNPESERLENAEKN